MRTKLKAFAVIWFYLAWFSCVFLARNDVAIYSLIFPFVSFYIANKLLPMNTQISLFYFLAIAVGILFDGIAAQMGLVTYLDEVYVFAPLWLISMWFLFVAILPVAAPLFQSKLWLAFVLGALFGPLTYYSGEQLGVLLFQSSWALYAYAIFWAIYFPGVVYLMNRFRFNNFR